MLYTLQIMLSVLIYSATMTMLRNISYLSTFMFTVVFAYVLGVLSIETYSTLMNTAILLYLGLEFYVSLLETSSWKIYKKIKQLPIIQKSIKFVDNVCSILCIAFQLSIIHMNYRTDSQFENIEGLDPWDYTGRAAVIGIICYMLDISLGLMSLIILSYIMWILIAKNGTAHAETFITHFKQRYTEYITKHPSLVEDTLMEPNDSDHRLDESLTCRQKVIDDVNLSGMIFH